MWTFAQLEQLPSQNLQTRARDLKDILLSKQAVVPEDFIKACRPNGESKATIQWILQGQCHLLAGLGHTHSPADFGFPAPEPGGIGAEAQIFAGELPSIKKTKESILIMQTGTAMEKTAMICTPENRSKWRSLIC